MARLRLWSMCALAVLSSAAQQYVYVSSYSGKVTTLALGCGAGRGSSNSKQQQGAGVRKLRVVSETDGCGASPSFLTLDADERRMLCVDEDLAGGRGSLSVMQTADNGALKMQSQVEGVGGPVFSAMYGDGRGVVVPNFAGSSLSVFQLPASSPPVLISTHNFTLAAPGPVPDRQTAPRPHQAVPDPSGRFIVVPDLGADVVRVFAVSAEGIDLEERKSVAVAPGSGPRHVAFAQMPGGDTYMYLVNELASTVVGFKVEYPEGGIEMRTVFSMGVHGMDRPVPKQAFASEIVVSPDNRFAIISSRNENPLSIPNLDAANSTRAISDPLINLAINPRDGSLSLLQDNVPAGGRFPRHFSLNRKGSLLAIGLQHDARVALVERDPHSGMIGGFVAYADVAGEITSVIFDE